MLDMAYMRLKNKLIKLSEFDINLSEMIIWIHNN